MSIVLKQVWVIGPDYGLEGKGEPEMVFLDERTARVGLALINKRGGVPHYLSAVPVWNPGPVKPERQAIHASGARLGTSGSIQSTTSANVLEALKAENERLRDVIDDLERASGEVFIGAVPAPKGKDNE